MSRSTKRWRFFTRIVMLCLILALSSCKVKASKDADLSASELSAAADSGSSQKLFKVRYTPKWSPQAQFAGFYMAQAKGFYQDYGLDVQIMPHFSEEQTLDDLNQGRTDFCTLFLVSALNTYAPDTKLLNLAQFSQSSTLMYVGKRKRGITSIASMNHKRLGLWLSEFKLISESFCSKNQIRPIFIPVENNNVLFINDAIDIINVMEYNEYHSLLMSGMDEEDLYVIRMRDQGYNIVEDGLYTTQSFFESHRKECINFAEASRDGWVYALNHPEETLEVVMKIMRDSHTPASINHQKWMLEKLGESFLARPNHFGELDPSAFEAAKSLFMANNPNLRLLMFEDFFPNVLAQHK